MTRPRNTKPQADGALAHPLIQRNPDWNDSTVRPERTRAIHQAMPSTAKHSLQECIKGAVHANGIESLGSMLKRAHNGTFHKISLKHLARYAQEFADSHNMLEHGTIDQLRSLCSGMQSRRLTYKASIKDNWCASGTKATV